MSTWAPVAADGDPESVTSLLLSGAAASGAAGSSAAAGGYGAQQTPRASNAHELPAGTAEYDNSAVTDRDGGEGCYIRTWRSTQVFCYRKTYKEVYEDHENFTRQLDGADFRNFLKDLWTAYAVVNALLLSTSMSAFTTFVGTSAGSDSAQTWRSVTLALLWATVVAANAISVCVTLLSQAHILKVPASGATVRNFSDVYDTALSYPSWWTAGGALLFVLAVVGTITIFIIGAFSSIACRVVIPVLAFLVLLFGAGAALWYILDRQLTFANQMEPIRVAYSNEAVKAAVEEAAARSSGEGSGAAGSDLLIEALIRRLKCSKKIADQEACAIALGNLAFTSASRAAAESSIRRLIHLLGSKTTAVQKAAAATLGNLAENNVANQLAIRNRGGIRKLTQLLGSSSESVQKSAIAAVHSLASSRVAIDAALGEAGAIPLLVRYLSSNDSAVAVAAAEALAVLAFGTLNNATAIEAAGGIPALVQLINRGKKPAQEAAIQALDSLTGGPKRPSGERAAIKAAISRAGGIPPLVRVLGRVSQAAQKDAIDTLHSLEADSPGDAAEVCKHGGISAFIRALKKKQSGACASCSHLRAGCLRDRRQFRHLGKD
ncbi:hypothetical protein ABPG77_003181 [Micractinium sp. CCAP 211/92]